MESPTDKEIIKHVNTIGYTDEPEIDDNAEVSRSEDGTGAYVQAWVWVDFSDMKAET